jgi:hypothetical protein
MRRPLLIDLLRNDKRLRRRDKSGIEPIRTVNSELETIK